MPRDVIITDVDVREAVGPSINQFVEAIKEVLETTPPEVISDIMHRGIILVGAGSQIRGLKELLEDELEIPIQIIADPQTAVIRGTAVVLEDLPGHREFLIDNEDEVSPRS